LSLVTPSRFSNNEHHAKPKQRPRFIDPFQPAHIRRLVKEFGSPLLIVDCERIRVQFRKLRKALPGVDLHYALKPMPHPLSSRPVMEEGGWLDLADYGEVHWSIAWCGPQALYPYTSHQRDQDIRKRREFRCAYFRSLTILTKCGKFAKYTDNTELLLRLSFRSRER